MVSKRKCPRYDGDDSENQIRRHLKIQRERITHELANRFDDNKGDEGGEYGNDEGGNDAIFGGTDEGDGGMDLGDAGMEELADRDVEIGLDDAGSASDDDPLPDRPHGAVEDYASVRGTVHNPPMIYVEWHEPPVDEADDSEDEGEDEDNIERDPAYVEHDVPLGLNPLDESGLRDEDVQGMLELDLEDSAAEEWDGMYARYISRRTWTPKKTLPSLSKPRVNWKYEHGVQAFSREVIYPEFPTVVLGTPIRRVPLEQPLTSHLARCFGHFSPEQNTTQVTERIEADSMIRYGRLRLAGDGDRIRTAALVDNDPIARDKSFIKAPMVPASDSCLDAFKYAKPEDTVEPADHQPADRSCCRRASSHSRPEWAIVDRSRDNARAQFVDDEGNVEFAFEPEEQHTFVPIIDCVLTIIIHPRKVRSHI
ncbi:hypothetical protein FRC09_013256 [Ceratobasidium sp. 395]|nr:hypothetical protein FRC09_013256 [Ceratobasidium sp. 395]